MHEVKLVVALLAVALGWIVITGLLSASLRTRKLRAPRAGAVGTMTAEPDPQPVPVTRSLDNIARVKSDTWPGGIRVNQRPRVGHAGDAGIRQHAAHKNTPPDVQRAMTG